MAHYANKVMQHGLGILERLLCLALTTSVRMRHIAECQCIKEVACAWQVVLQMGVLLRLMSKIT